MGASLLTSAQNQTRSDHKTRYPTFGLNPFETTQKYTTLYNIWFFDETPRPTQCLDPRYTELSCDFERCLQVTRNVS